jgi:acetyl esterase/lipase
MLTDRMLHFGTHPLRTSLAVLCWACALAGEAVAAEPLSFPIWPDAPPGQQSILTEEVITERSEPPALRDRIVTGITTPHLAVFTPSSPNGDAVLVLPGGGYQRVVMDKEGYETAEWLAERGITAYVLFYRLPGEYWSAGPDTPLQDTQRALRWIRHNAGDFDVNPQRVGVMGFSAGGHAAATLITRFADPVYDAVDAADRQSARPDFAALIYPVISMRDGLAHSGSRERLLGKDFDAAGIAAHSPELRVRPDTPPTFLLHAADDESVPASNSLAMYEALRTAGVSAEMHLFAIGGHGFGLRYVAGKPVAAWPRLLETWIDALP